MKSIGSTERVAVLRAELRELRFKRSLLDGEIYAKEERMMTMVTELSALMVKKAAYLKVERKRRLKPDALSDLRAPNGTVGAER